MHSRLPGARACVAHRCRPGADARHEPQAAQGDAEVAQCRTLLTQRQSEIRGLERRCDELEAEARWFALRYTL